MRLSSNFFLFAPALILFITLGCVNSKTVSLDELEYTIPEQSDWVDHGIIFKAGEFGEWDHLLWGGFTNTAVKRDDTYYLYYQGAREYVGAPYDTVVWRAIGLATSQDGINFTKYEGNPVLTWFPSGSPGGNGEEGAVSGGVTLDERGDIVLYYGANTAIGPTKVNADGRLAISEDGFNFTDVGAVLEHDDDSIWGSGDELFPIAALNDGDQWVVYYLPNGGGKGRNLGVAWGDTRDNLDNSAAVRSGFTFIKAWGTAGKAKVGPNTYAIFTNWVTDPRTEVRLMSLEAPNRLSEPVQTYRFEDVLQATILLDEETHTWFMYYRGENYYGVKLAPAGEPDETPPSQPTGILVKPVNESSIELKWEAAVDSETGVAAYKIYRNGIHMVTVTGLQFIDQEPGDRAKNVYTITAVNYHGTESKPSDPVSATSWSDGFLPFIAAEKDCHHLG